MAAVKLHVQLRLCRVGQLLLAVPSEPRLQGKRARKEGAEGGRLVACFGLCDAAIGAYVDCATTHL
jgi:hypothetical protein